MIVFYIGSMLVSVIITSWTPLEETASSSKTLFFQLFLVFGVH